MRDERAPPAAAATTAEIPWPWLAVWLLVAAWFWWPGGLEFRSDDHLAVVYAQDLANVGHDFAGPYQSAVRLALFYRPLITLSVWIDCWLGGSGPFLPLLMNALVHGANALLLWRLLARRAAPPAALAAAAAWSFLPGHVGAVSWMVGRVDTHAAFFYLLCLLLADPLARGRRRWPGWLAMFLGGITKELCLTLPAAVFVLHACTPGTGSGIGARLRAAAGATAPYLGVLLALALLRFLFLGEVIGGYAAQTWQPAALGAALQHLGTLGTRSHLALLAPLLLASTERRRALPVLGAALLLYAIAALPALGAAQAGDPKTERYFYLPAAALAGMLAFTTPRAGLILLVLAVLAGGAERETLHAVTEEVRAVRREATARLAATQATDDPIFIHAPAESRGHVLFHVGTDRLGCVPFAPRPDRTVLPRRPMWPGATTAAGDPPRGPLDPVYEGPAPLDEVALRRVDLGEKATLGLRGVAAATYDVTVATSLGLIALERVAAPGGRLDLKALIVNTPLPGVPAGAPTNLLLALWPSLEVSLRPEPLLFLTARDAEGRVLGHGARPLVLPLTRDVGRALQPQEPRVWLLGLLAFTALLAAALRSRGPTDRPASRLVAS